MLKFLQNFLDRICVVIGALFFVQFPLFMQQYRHQLIGHVAELQFQLQKMRTVATASGKTLEQFIQKFMTSGDQDFSGQGIVMSEMIERWTDLSNSLFAMDNASIWTRPFVFVSHMNYDIAQSTLHSFEPGLPLSYEGAVYALCGICIGYLMFVLIAKLCKSICGCLFPKKTSKA